MQNQEILAKAIQKVLDSGWLYPNHTADTKYRTSMFGSEVSFATYVADKLEADLINEVYKVIYDKDFAKALWGEEAVSEQEGELGKYYSDDPFDNVRFNGDAWQYHLQEMVIAEDPIEYLGKHI